MGWQDEVIPADFTVEHGGQQISAREIPFIKESPDFPTFLKRSIDNHRAIGSSIRLPNGESKPEDIAKWREEHLPKLQKAGIIPAAPEKYEIKRPDGLPEGAWSESLEAKAHEWGKKHGLSQEAVNDAMGLYLESFAGFAEPIMKSRQEAEAAFITRMKAEGKDPVQVAEGAKRWAETNIKDEKLREKLAHAGLMDDPDVVYLLYQASAASGNFDTRNDGGSTVDEATAQSAKQEIEAIRNDKNNPRHEKYIKGDAETLKYMDSLYAKLTGGR